MLTESKGAPQCRPLPPQEIRCYERIINCYHPLVKALLRPFFLVVLGGIGRVGPLDSHEGIPTLHGLWWDDLPCRGIALATRDSPSISQEIGGLSTPLEPERLRMLLGLEIQGDVYSWWQMVFWVLSYFFGGEVGPKDDGHGDEVAHNKYVPYLYVNI